MEPSERGRDSGNSVQTAERPSKISMMGLSPQCVTILQLECRAPVAICSSLQARPFIRFIAASDTNYWVSFPT